MDMQMRNNLKKNSIENDWNFNDCKHPGFLSFLMIDYDFLILTNHWQGLYVAGFRGASNYSLPCDKVDQHCETHPRRDNIHTTQSIIFHKR